MIWTGYPTKFYNMERKDIAMLLNNVPPYERKDTTRLLRKFCNMKRRDIKRLPNKILPYEKKSHGKIIQQSSVIWRERIWQGYPTNFHHMERKEITRLHKKNSTIWEKKTWIFVPSFSPNGRGDNARLPNNFPLNGNTCHCKITQQISTILKERI